MKVAPTIDEFLEREKKMRAELTLIRCILGLSPIHSTVEAVRTLHDAGRGAFEKQRGERCEHWHEWKP